MAFQYRDENGNPTLTYGTNVPGLYLVPVGKKPQDAVTITNKEHTKLIEASTTRPQPPDPRYVAIAQLTDKLAKMQARVDKIEANPNTTSNPGVPTPPTP